MVKYFCDKCQSEITPKNECVGGSISEDRLGVEIPFRTDQPGIVEDHVLRIEIIHSFDGTANAGIICKYCVLDALYKLDDREAVSEDSPQHQLQLQLQNESGN